MGEVELILARFFATTTTSKAKSNIDSVKIVRRVSSAVWELETAYRMTVLLLAAVPTTCCRSEKQTCRQPRKHQ